MQCCAERVQVSCTVSSALDQCIGPAGFPALPPPIFNSMTGIKQTQLANAVPQETSSWPHSDSNILDVECGNIVGTSFERETPPVGNELKNIHQGRIALLPTAHSLADGYTVPCTSKRSRSHKLGMGACNTVSILEVVPTVAVQMVARIAKERIGIEFRVGVWSSR